MNHLHLILLHSSFCISGNIPREQEAGKRKGWYKLLLFTHSKLQIAKHHSEKLQLWKEKEKHGFYNRGQTV